MSSLTAVQLVYRDISQPKSAGPAPAPVRARPPIHLEPWEVDAILRSKRNATLEELGYIVEHAKEFALSKSQQDQLGVRMTIALAARANPTVNPNAALFDQLDVVETPAGLLHSRSWFEQELRNGAQAIWNCRDHRLPRCSCWRVARERLWHVQDTFGAKSPEAWMATRTYALFEEMETARRPEPLPGLGAPPKELQPETRSFK